jgi:hypothetical protein
MKSFLCFVVLVTLVFAIVAATSALHYEVEVDAETLVSYPRPASRPFTFWAKWCPSKTYEAAKTFVVLDDEPNEVDWECVGQRVPGVVKIKAYVKPDFGSMEAKFGDKFELVIKTESEDQEAIGMTCQYIYDSMMELIRIGCAKTNELWAMAKDIIPFGRSLVLRYIIIGAVVWAFFSLLLLVLIMARIL